MITNRTEYNDLCNARENAQLALKTICAELQTLKDINSDGYNLMYIEEMAGILVNLKHILEGGDTHD